MSRLFGEKVPDLASGDNAGSIDNDSLFPWIEENEIGSKEVFETPFGLRKVLYCDYSASARAIGPIEDYIKSEVLPLYGNTHSSVTVTSEQTTLFTHEARAEIRSITGAGDNDDVIFTGSGTTAAIELLIHLINKDNLVVLHSIIEHHSNLLPWKAVAKELVRVDEDEHGRIDKSKLEDLITSTQQRHPNCTIVCTFTACSNVTGILMDVSSITSIAKRNNCLSVWDFASAAPYVNINMNYPVPIDAIYFSGHKLIGGVGTPGVLVVKKTTISNTLPKRIGGGTVFFVSPNKEYYLKNAEYREEGGTPDSVGIIRLALSLKLKHSISSDVLLQREHFITSWVIDYLKDLPNVCLLGAPTKMNRIPVFSFIVKHKDSSLFYHHNYISALLNDLFGIQSRSGCMCAGPYAQHLLGIDEHLADDFFNALKEAENLDRTHLRRAEEYSNQEMLRPGFSRISIPFFWSNEKIQFVLDSLKFISENASKFICQYQLNCESGEWHHQKQRTFHNRKWLGHLNFTSNGMVNTKPIKLSNIPKDFDCLKEAEKLAEQAEADKTVVPDGRVAVNSDNTHLRWFVLPIEVYEERKHIKISQTSPFIPRHYEGSDESEVEFSSNNLPTTSSQSAETGQCPLSTLLENVECPLDLAGQLQQEEEEDTPPQPEEMEDAKGLEDWNKRVVVTRRELSREEEAKLPWITPPLDMYKKTCEAIHGLDMIKEGDKVLVCLSGGKDSLALLHILHFYQKRCIKNRSTNFQLGAITVDPGSTAYNPRPLIEYCRSLNLDYFYEEQDIIGAAKKLNNVRSICAFCSRMKRGRLAAAAVHHGWNVLAMGQHLDDLAESFFIAAFQNGNLSTMKAQYTTRDTSLRVIRPLVFVREKDLRMFSESSKLPIIAENCPACFNQATERHRIKQLLAQQELVFPDLFNSLRSALRPLLLVDSASTDQMRALAIENIVLSNKGKAK